jgi:hypoxanthine phosphoribosyltransferase
MQFFDVSWHRTETMINRLVSGLADTKLEFVYGYPRGGTIPAVILSHRLGLKYVTSPIRGFTLFVDDIVDSGQTVNKDVAEGQTVVSLFRRESCSLSTMCGEVVPDGIWLCFPWEDRSKAKIEYQDYLKSRGKSKI